MPGSPLIASSLEPESPLDEATTPTRLGKYLLVRRLARGGMGDVHLAKLPGELGFEKFLVVKTIRSELAADPRFVELFASEAKTAVALSHPNIAPIYELGRAEDGSLYTAMGWVDGPSLAQWIDRLRHAGEPGRFELGAVLLIVRELLDGLAHAHSRDQGRAPVVHRDVTPRNVLVDRSGRVQIVDFGIAKPVDAAEVRGVMGSVGYMAPEQARGEPVDPRADVFSVGCVLYELLTLEQAFPREGVWMLPSFAKVPVELHRVLARALALEPGERFADAREFLRQLAPLLSELAPTYATPDLAVALREQFASRGWTEADERPNSGATPSTLVTPVHRTVAFAIRDTAVDEGLDEPASAESQPEADEPSVEIPVALDPPRSVRRHPVIWAVGGAAVALLIGLLVPALLDRGRDRDPPDDPAPIAVDEQLEPASGPIEPASERREHHPAPSPSPLLAPTIAAPIIEITLAPADAELWLDGSLVEGPPHRLTIADPRTIEVRAAGHRTRSVEIDPSGPALVHVALDPLGEGQLTVLAPSVAWAEVWLDGDKLGSTPLTELPVIEGRHKLEVRCLAEVCGDERSLVRKTLQIRAGRTTKINAANPE
ncbi:serine/threonine-protein kinase [Nannocystaceae bacterium ST9]